MQERQIVPFVGGLDLVTPHIDMAPGHFVAAQNYEPAVKGIRRIDGFERYDGRPQPSKATYSILDFDAGTADITAGTTVDGGTSGASGIAVVDAVVESGSFGGSDAAGYLVLYNISGTFQDDEALEVSSTQHATADGAPVASGADTDTLDATYEQAAIEARRTSIAAVPGSGDIRGIATYNGDVYAFRDNAAATEGVMYKATTSGWSAQSFGHTVDFSAGTAEFEEGETLTGGTSGATATIRRIILREGDWSGSAVGYLVVDITSGTFQASETITATAGSATCSGAQVAVTFPPGGKVRTVVHNFYGVQNRRRLYGVNGVGYGWEWDGTTLAPIRTGVDASLDTPEHVAVHENHLAFGYEGGSVIFSGTGTPLIFTFVAGAGEFGIGESITHLFSATRDSLIIGGRNIIAYLTGKDSANFAVNYFSEDSGMIAESAQIVGQPIFMDDRGVRDLQAADTYGDWQIGTMTRRIEPLISSLRRSGRTVAGSVRVRAKDQYRLYWDDGTGFTIYFGRNDPEIVPFSLGKTPTAFASGEDANGDEMLFMGDSAGMVYQLDQGTSLDGGELDSWFRTSYLHQGDPNRAKRYHRTLFNIDADGVSTSLTVAADFQYSSPKLPSKTDESLTFAGAGGFWDIDNWDAVVWDGTPQDDVYVETNGIGANVSYIVASTSTYEMPHTISSMTIFYSPRRLLR